jgi:hypothetical protein
MSRWLNSILGKGGWKVQQWGYVCTGISTADRMAVRLLLQVAPGDESVIRGKSQGGGCCIKKTHTALVIGTYKSPVQPGDVNMVVENLGDYLAGQNF